MAQALLHPAFDGISGRSGALVFRHVRGKTVIATRPEQRTRRSSTAQEAQRERFVRARWYAKQVLADPWQREAYEVLAQQHNRRADLLVVSDYMTPPVVTRIDVSGYQRRPGGMIRILAHDDVEVVSVEVTIQTAAGVIVERGPATRMHGVWCYRTTAAAPDNELLSLMATARDRPGHEGSRQLEV